MYPLRFYATPFSSAPFWFVAVSFCAIFSLTVSPARCVNQQVDAFADSHSDKSSGKAADKAGAAAPVCAADSRQDKVVRADAQRYFNKVNEVVSKNFYNAEVSRTVWPDALEKNKERILESKNLSELYERMNEPLKALKSSHTQFVTANDEIYYFLHSLFGAFNKKIPNPKMDFTGITTGGVGKDFNCVRYVLEESPGALAGIQRNDVIESVDGQKYLGQLNFAGRAGHEVALKLRRGDTAVNVTLTPKRERDYDQYVKAIQKSVQIIPSAVGRLGYIRYWTGGQLAHDVFERNFLSEQMTNTEGVIIDLRDGYGGNSTQDLDMLYRPPLAYPKFTSIARSGKRTVDQDYYDKPVVVLVNRGSRSGKELLAYGLKNSGRAKLVGDNTAGYVLAGRLFPIDDRAALYLAVVDVYLNSDRLEGKGVAPDVLVPDDAEHPNGFNEQTEMAKTTLIDLIRKKQESAKQDSASDAK